MIDGEGANPFQIGHLRILAGVVQPPHCGIWATFAGAVCWPTGQRLKWWRSRSCQVRCPDWDPDLHVM